MSNTPESIKGAKQESASLFTQLKHDLTYSLVHSAIKLAGRIHTHFEIISELYTKPITANIAGKVIEKLSSILPNVECDDRQIRFSVDLKDMPLSDKLDIWDSLSQLTGFSGGMINNGPMVFTYEKEGRGTLGANSCSGVIARVLTNKDEIADVLLYAKECLQEQPYTLAKGDFAKLTEPKLKTTPTVAPQHSGQLAIA